MCRMKTHSSDENKAGRQNKNAARAKQGIQPVNKKVVIVVTTKERKKRTRDWVNFSNKFWSKTPHFFNLKNSDFSQNRKTRTERLKKPGRNNKQTVKQFSAPPLASTHG